MAKHSKRNKKKSTLLEQFHSFRKTHKKDDDILTFLAIASTEYVGKSKSGLTEKDKKELLEFYDYFWENYDYMEEAIENEWLIDPPIFRLAAELEYSAYEEKFYSYVSQATDDDLDEAIKLTNLITDMKKECYIAVYSSSELPSDVWDIKIPKLKQIENREEIDEDLLDMFTVLIVCRGVAYIRTESENKLELFGIKVSNEGKWRPMPKEEVIKNLYTSADGVVQEPDENTIISEFK